MGAIEIIGGIVLLLLCVGIIAAVTVQESKGALGALAGESSGSFFDKNRGKTKEAMLVRVTSIMAAALIVVTVIILFVTK